MEDIMEESKKINISERVKFGEKNSYYQSFPPLNIAGLRNTKGRIKSYKIEKFLNNSHDVLNIGSNCGFLDIIICKNVKSITSLEQHSKLSKIQKLIVDHYNIENINIINEKFPCEYLEDKKFSAVFSLACRARSPLPLGRG